MFGIDAEIAALPVTMASQNMIRLVHGRACAYRVIGELEGECGKQKYGKRYEENLFLPVVEPEILEPHLETCLSVRA